MWTSTSTQLARITSQRGLATGNVGTGNGGALRQRPRGQQPQLSSSWRAWPALPSPQCALITSPPSPGRGPQARELSSLGPYVPPVLLLIRIQEEPDHFTVLVAGCAHLRASRNRQTSPSHTPTPPESRTPLQTMDTTKRPNTDSMRMVRKQIVPTLLP